MKFSSLRNSVCIGLAFLLPYITSAQCAMCRAALQTGDQVNTAEGINHGITYLMMFPYIIAGVIAYAIYKIYKKEGDPTDSSI